jgi:hypothetical protein
MLGFVLALAAEPLCKFFRKRLRWRQSPAAFAAVTLCLMLVLGVLWLAGAAAVEQFFGTSDGGSREDLDIAFGEANRLVTRDCICGMHLHSEGFEAPEQIQVAQDQATAVLVEKYFRLAKEILAANREFFDKLSDALAKKQCLMMQEVQSIKASCLIVPFSL